MYVTMGMGTKSMLSTLSDVQDECVQDEFYIYAAQDELSVRRMNLQHEQWIRVNIGNPRYSRINLQDEFPRVPAKT